MPPVAVINFGTTDIRDSGQSRPDQKLSIRRNRVIERKPPQLIEYRAPEKSAVDDWQTNRRIPQRKPIPPGTLVPMHFYFDAARSISKYLATTRDHLCGRKLLQEFRAAMKRPRGVDVIAVQNPDEFSCRAINTFIPGVKNAAIRLRKQSQMRILFQQLKRTVRGSTIYDPMLEIRIVLSQYTFDCGTNEFLSIEDSRNNRNFHSTETLPPGSAACGGSGIASTSCIPIGLQLISK